MLTYANTHTCAYDRLHCECCSNDVTLDGLDRTSWHPVAAGSNWLTGWTELRLRRMGEAAVGGGASGSEHFRFRCAAAAAAAAIDETDSSRPVFMHTHILGMVKLNAHT